LGVGMSKRGALQKKSEWERGMWAMTGREGE
jgi:hypothetical protein